MAWLPNRGRFLAAICSYITTYQQGWHSGPGLFYALPLKVFQRHMDSAHIRKGVICILPREATKTRYWSLSMYSVDTVYCMHLKDYMTWLQNSNCGAGCSGSSASGFCRPATGLLPASIQCRGSSATVVFNQESTMSASGTASDLHMHQKTGGTSTATSAAPSVRKSASARRRAPGGRSS